MPIQFTGPSGIQNLTPTPFVGISKKIVKDGAGRKLGGEYIYTLNGTIVNVDNTLDSPGASGYSTMEGILGEQKRLRELFSVNNGLLTIQSPDGTNNKQEVYCTVEDINFNQGNWVNRCEYTVTLKSPIINGENFEDNTISSCDESWDISENPDRTFHFSHRLSAVGTLIYASGIETDGLGAARQWCSDRSYGISSNGTLTRPPSGLIFNNLVYPISSGTANFWNLKIVESPGIKSNSWQITEDFIYHSGGSAIEEYNASISFDGPRKISASIAGSVIGYAGRDSDYETKITNATSKYNSIKGNIYTRLLNYVPSGFILNPVPDTSQITYEPYTGSIRYSNNYSGASGTLIPNAITEDISISDIGKTDIFAEISVPGRANGPIFQYMETSTAPERTINISASLQLDNTTLTLVSLANMYAAKPNTDSIINALKPNAGYYYIKQNSEEWNPIKKQYGRTVSWVLQTEGSGVACIPSGISNPYLG